MGTDFWQLTIENETKAEGIALKFVNDRTVGHTDINWRLVFDVKIDFTCKARYVASGHLTNTPDNVPTYTYDFSWELAHILLLIAALYNIEVLAADIINAFPNAQ